MSTFADLISLEGDHDDWQGWAQRQLELEEQYETSSVPSIYREEERLDRAERARDMNNVGRRHY